jgi:hypothetical protein
MSQSLRTVCSVSEPTVSPSQRLWESSVGDRAPIGLRPPVEYEDEEPLAQSSESEWGWNSS